TFAAYDAGVATSTLHHVFFFLDQSTVNKRSCVLNGNICKNQDAAAQGAAQTQRFVRGSLHEALFGYDGSAMDVDASKGCFNGRRYGQGSFAIIAQHIQSDGTCTVSFHLARDSGECGDRLHGYPSWIIWRVPKIFYDEAVHTTLD